MLDIIDYVLYLFCVSFYCTGRGLGGILGYVLLLYITREVLLKVLAISSVIICLFYLFSHYCFLKPSPYGRRYDMETSSFGNLFSSHMI